MPTYSQLERQALVDALLAAGPDAPTLCEGWTTRDLAAHLVVRERRPDSGPGILIPAFAGWTEKVRKGYAARPYADLVEMVRTGPPAFSPMAIPALEAQANLAEHFIHCEDVRRAQQGWTPRDLGPEFEDAIWSRLRGQGRLSVRRSPVGVVLERTDRPAGPGAEPIVAKDLEPRVTLRGKPSELLLHLFNRTSATLVEVTGDPAAVEQFSGVRLGL